MKKRFILAITGASGSVYAVKVLEAMLKAGHEVHLLASKNGEKVLAYETGSNLKQVVAQARSLAMPEASLILHDNANLFAPVASGSFPVDGMAVVPCSMATLGGIASGSLGSLIGRAADVCIKERKPLVLVPRETPLSVVHLQNMLRLDQAGAVILPAMPAFYGRPATLEDLVAFMAGKILDALKIPNSLTVQWKDEKS
ncbi:MAG TPA: aromatic acid decarboxylase [Clostridiales bacterium]|nr:aromatic acid decarboxylase [Clostridiales bacterium]